MSPNPDNAEDKGFMYSKIIIALIPPLSRLNGRNIVNSMGTIAALGMPMNIGVMI